ncbi:MAG TPA: glutamate-cysteine ligase family protein [Gemmatimonadaceae bacterium]
MSLTESDLRAGIKKLFEPKRSEAPGAVGAELELIPVDASSSSRILASPPKKSRTVGVLHALSEARSWTERAYEGDPPSWTLPDGACISFEPGGQIEISSAPHPTASATISSVSDLVTGIANAMSAEGMELLTNGVDPYNTIDSVPLQLHRERYSEMTRYFDALSPSGIQMMRQTAALQINVERGEDPVHGWRLLNALAPFVLALFANSSSYAGRDTGWQSYRSYFWRTLDPSRTGLAAPDGDPADGYFEFAMEAFAMRGGVDGKAYRSFRDTCRNSDIDETDWQFHLSTLFPEVRAKEHFELRSADTIAIDDLAAPIVFVTSIIYDPESADAATSILPLPTLALLERAGREGIRDAEIRKLCAELATLSVEGAHRLGQQYITDEHLEIARNYFERKLGLD